MVARRRTKKDNASALLDEVKAAETSEREHLLKVQIAASKESEARAEAQRKLAVRDAREAQAALAASIEAKERWSPLRIKRREKKSRIHEATAVLLYSDLHPDEVVTPDTVAGLNEFNADIAIERNARLARAVAWNLDMLRDKNGRSGYRIRDFILAILGDIISNSIHPELMESNSMLPADALLFAEQLAVHMIDSLLADPDIETLWIPCCHGNHDRMTVKSRHQTKAGNSLALIFYHHLAQRYKDDPRVKFDIARGNMIYTDVYGGSVRWTHGDDVRYNGGIGGLTIPMRKAIDSWNQSHFAELTCCGHWHNHIDEEDFIVNGSLIGYTAFAQAIKARYRPASQTMFLLDKDYWKGWVKDIKLQGKGQWKRG